MNKCASKLAGEIIDLNYFSQTKNIYKCTPRHVIYPYSESKLNATDQLTSTDPDTEQIQKF